MPAPAGFKTFVAGAVLTATSDVQIYLMDQVVTVWADASARTSGLASPAEGQVSYLKDDDKIYTYSGAAWVELAAGISWSGSTANGLGTYSSSSEIVAESTATYDGTTLQLTTAGGGLKLDGLNSSDANTLDDYEEGTFTAGLASAGSGTITIHPSYDTGAYVKVGKLVHIQGLFLVSAISSPTGTLRVTGLPFTSSSAGMPETSDYGFNMGSVVKLASAAPADITTQLHPNGTYFDLNAAGGATAVTLIANLVDTGTEFYISGVYRADT